MFGGTKVKVDKDLFERAKRFANLVGYSTVDESASEEEIKKRLQGLGYIS
jgi:hypothetical protein